MTWYQVNIARVYGTEDSLYNVNAPDVLWSKLPPLTLQPYLVRCCTFTPSKSLKEELFIAEQVLYWMGRLADVSRALP